MTRVAAIDCGTNSIRLLISDLATDGSAAPKRDLAREMRIVRLGSGVDRTGRLDDEALARTFEACDEYARLVRSHDVEAVRFCATSATRDAANARVFGDGVRDRFGVSPDVLTGDEEADLSYAGATRELPDIATPLLVADLGGGSTELIVGTGEHPEAAESLDVGSVRLTERHLRADPPTPEQLCSCECDVDAALDACDLDLARVRALVGVAGTNTTLAAHALGLSAYDPSRLHHARIGFERLADSCAAIIAATVAERRVMPFMHPGRADVIGGGAVIVQRLLSRLDKPEAMVVSEHDILDGIAWSLLA